MEVTGSTRGVVIWVVDVLEMLFRCHGAIDAGMPGLGGAMGGAPADGRCRYHGNGEVFLELQGVPRETRDVF